MSIAIAGATGNISRHLVHKLCEQGVRPRLLLRQPEKVAATLASVCTVVQADLRSEDSLVAALQGADSFFFCIPQSSQPPDLLDYYRQFGAIASQALPRAGIRRVVFVSSGGRGRADNAGPISALHTVEQQLESAGLSVCALRCGNFMENLLSQVAAIRQAGLFSLPIDGDCPLPTVAAQDIASVASRHLQDASWAQSFAAAVHGPEDLSSHQVASRLGPILGRSLRFQQLAPATFKANLIQHGASESFAQGMIDMFRAVAAGAYGAEPRTQESTTPTRIEQWAQVALLPALGKS